MVGESPATWFPRVISERSGWVRAATTTDSAQVAAVFLRCWKLSYADLLSATALDFYDAESAGRLWQRLLARSGTIDRIMVAGVGPDVGDGPAGTRGRVAAVSRVERSGYLASLYVDPRVQGTGLGRRLITEAEMYWTGNDVEIARLWVFAENHRARSFYERCGYLDSGRTRIETNYEATEVELTKKLRR